MKKIYSDEQIVGFVREAEKTEVTIAEFCRQKGFNEGTFYKWKKRFGSMQVAEVKRLRELEAENARLKRLLADRMIEIDAMQELLAKKW
jgi:putative transposase